MKKIVLILSFLSAISSPHHSQPLTSSLTLSALGRTSPLSAQFPQLDSGLGSLALALWLRPELLLVSAYSPYADIGQPKELQSILLNANSTRN